MIALDTNVLLRYLMQDDPVQSGLSNEVIEGLTPENRAFVSREVLVELFWVLERTFRLPRLGIASALKVVADLDIWLVEDPDRFFSAIAEYEQGGAGFADQMIRLAGRAAGCDRLVTFDRELARQPGVTLLG